jgi:hypothetical protein
VGPRFTNLICSWRPFVNRNQAGMCTEPKLTSNWLPCWYSQLAAVASLCVRNPRNRSSSETFFARKICSWTELFVNRAFVNRGPTVLINYSAFFNIVQIEVSLFPTPTPTFSMLLSALNVGVLKMGSLTMYHHDICTVLGHFQAWIFHCLTNVSTVPSNCHNIF